MLLNRRAVAHDYWLVPSVLEAPKPTPITLSLVLGEKLVVEEEKPLVVARTKRFTHTSARGLVDLLPAAKDGAAPLTSVMLDEGGHLFLLERTPARLELPSERFEAYLRDEGLETIVEQRAALGEKDRPGRERYTRYLQAFVQVGTSRDESHGGGRDLELAIVPMENPALVQPGRSLNISVFFRGQPLVGAELNALRRSGTGDVRSIDGVTDAAGQWAIPVDAEGEWLVRMVHMVRCEGCDDADWHSFWASYSFGNAHVTFDQPGTVVAPPASGAKVTPSAKGCACSLQNEQETAWGFVAWVGAAFALRGRRRQASSIE